MTVAGSTCPAADKDLGLDHADGPYNFPDHRFSPTPFGQSLLTALAETEVVKGSKKGLATVHSPDRQALPGSIDT